MRMDSWAIHGSNQAMNQRAQAWQRQRQRHNLNLVSERSCDWINWQSKKKRKGNRLSSVHSEGSVGMGGSRVFCLVWGLGSYLFYGLWSSLTSLSHADIHLRFRCLDIDTYCQGMSSICSCDLSTRKREPYSESDG